MLPKLVRDKIPDIIRASGKNCEIDFVTGDDYIQALDAKLVEELAEYRESHSLEELADILEVIYALTHALGYKYRDLHATCCDKAHERGGFNHGIILKKIYEKENSDD